MTPLVAWQSFYAIVGSSAGALTRLQFVVMALMADLPIRQGTGQTADAFGTPTVVHFGAVLLLSGIITAPWSGTGAPTLLIGISGVIGVGYVIVVARRARQQTVYRAVFEDWLFHVLLPAAAYGILAVFAYIGRSHLDRALFGIATAALALLFIGIHNAWDTVTYLLFVREEQHADRDEDRKRRD